MQQSKFKDLPVPAYFTYEGAHYQKMTATKVREFGTTNERIIRANPTVVYYGQDLNDFISVVNESN